MTGGAVLAGVMVVYALVASRLDRISVSAPMVFLVAGVLLGSSGANVLAVHLDEHALLLTELTLALLLFADASTVRLREVEGDARLPARLLFVGFPLTMLLGTVAARSLLAGIGWAEAALIGTILAPTDAALGLAVVTNRVVPPRIRRALNVESGLNDGIATPFLTLFLAVLATEEHVTAGAWLADAVRELGLALVVAAVVGGAGGRLLAAARSRGWTSPLSEQLAVVSLAVLAYAGAVALGGNGFVAAFAGGLAFRAPAGARSFEPVEFTETLALFASFLVWVFFGAALVGPVLEGGIGWPAVVYAVLSLTAVRMLSVAVSLVGTGFRPGTIAFMGWFGPRGLASVVFTMLAIETLHRGGPANAILVEVATLTVLFSVVAHGLTAVPLAAAYGRMMARGTDPMPEREAVAEPRLRRRALHAGSVGSER